MLNINRKNNSEWEFPTINSLLQIAPWDTMAVLYSGLMPIVRAHPNLFRPHISEFFVMQTDPITIKLQKLEVLELLVDERNVASVLSELQTYVRWYSYTPLVARAVQAMSTVALNVGELRMASWYGGAG